MTPASPRPRFSSLSLRASAGLVASAALLLGVAACGGSDSSPSSAGAPGAAGPNGGAAGTLTNGGAGAPNGSAGASGAGAGNGGAATGAMNGGAGATGGGGATSGAGGLGGGAAGTSGSGGASGGGGSAGAAGSGGSGGAPVYDPCPTNGDACRVMPLGDSITDGCCGENTVSMGASYRLALFQLSLDHNKKLTFVGSHTSGPAKVDNVAFPKQQEGHSGWTIADGGGRAGLQQQIVGWLKATPPDIITLMIGTNDVDISLDLPNAPKRLSTLIDTITSTVPKALVVVAKIVPTRKDDENLRDQTFNAALPAVVKTFTDAGKHVALVDMYGAYTKNTNYKTALLANDLHPSDAGYVVLANTWWDAIGALLPAK